MRHTLVCDARSLKEPRVAGKASFATAEKKLLD